MNKKNNQQKKLEEDSEFFYRAFKRQVKEAFQRFWNPIKNLFTWLFGKVARFFNRVIKAFAGVLPWLALSVLIVLWYLAVTQIPVRVWDLTPNFDSQTALLEANKLEADIAKSEVELSEQVSQAVLLERKGDFEAALQKYQSSEKSTLPIIRNYSSLAIQRVQKRLAYPLWQIVYNINNFLIQTPRWANMAFGAILALLALVFVYYQIPVKPGFAIGEFTTPKSIDKESEFGIEIRQTLADSIALIQLTHRTAQENLPLLTERLIVPSFGLSGSDKEELLQALVELGDAPILQTTGISIARLLNLVQLFSQRRRYVLIGSLNKLDEQWYLVAKSVDTKSKSLINQWEIRQSELTELELAAVEPQESAKEAQNQDINIIRKLGRALSYKILYSILKQSAPSLEAKSWKCFYHLTEGLWGLQEYGIDSSAKVSRNRAVAHLERLVKELDYGNRIARFDLGLLYMMQGNINEAQHVFEDLKSGIDSEPKAILNKIFQSLMKEGSRKNAESMISRYLWNKFSKEFGDIALKHRGGELPRVARAWSDFLPKLADYVRGGKFQSLDRLVVNSSLETLLENFDTGKPFRLLLGFPGDIKTEDAIKRFMEIVDSKDKTGLLTIAKSLRGEDETIRPKWDELSSILDMDHIEEMGGKLDRFEFKINSLKVYSGYLDIEQDKRETINALIELGNKAHSPVVRKYTNGIANVLANEDWEQAEEWFGQLKWYLSVSDPSHANYNMLQLLLATEEPPLIRLYSLMEPEKTLDYLSLYEWKKSTRQPIYVETLYNLALSHYLTFSDDGYDQAIACTEALISHLKTGNRLSVNPERRDEIANITSCLQINAYVRAYLSYRGTFDFDRAKDGEKIPTPEEIQRYEKIQKILTDDIERGDNIVTWKSIATINVIYPLTHHTSVEVRTAAYETLGLWSAYKNYYQGTEHEKYFQSALDKRSWASSYIYLAESKAKNNNYVEALRLLYIARRQMPNLSYIDVLEKAWQGKIAKPVEPEMIPLTIA